MRVWRDRTGKRWLRECTQSQTTCDYDLVPFGGCLLWTKEQNGKKIERLDTEINERGIRRESKKEAKAGREGRRKSERESFSFRQRTPSDSNMKVTALATLQLLLLPAVSVCFSSAFPKASLGGVSGLGAPPGSQCPHSKMASQADWWAQALPGWG